MFPWWSPCPLVVPVSPSGHPAVPPQQRLPRVAGGELFICCGSKEPKFTSLPRLGVCPCLRFWEVADTVNYFLPFTNGGSFGAGAKVVRMGGFCRGPGPQSYLGGGECFCTPSSSLCRSQPKLGHRRHQPTGHCPDGLQFKGPTGCPCSVLLTRQWGEPDEEPLGQAQPPYNPGLPVPAFGGQLPPEPTWGPAQAVSQRNQRGRSLPVPVLQHVGTWSWAAPG